MSTHRRTWQKAEERVAAFFGCRRQVLSGSSNRDDRSRADATHDRLFLETKFRESHAARTLLDATAPLAHREGKVPVVALVDKGRPGFLVCCHSGDFAQVVAEWAAGLGKAEADALEGLIRSAWLRRNGELAERGEDAA